MKSFEKCVHAQDGVGKWRTMTNLNIWNLAGKSGVGGEDPSDKVCGRVRGDI
jgi:hypothetical protein